MQLYLKIGNTEQITVNFTYTALDETIQPVDITGCKVYFTIKKNLADPDSSALLQYDTTTHSDPVNGITVLNLSSTLTKTLIPGIFKYDVKIKFPDNSIKSVNVGTVEVLDVVTDRDS